MSTIRIKITLAGNIENTLTSGGQKAGLNVPEGASLTIKSGGPNPGRLTARCKTTADDAETAGIGGSNKESSDEVTMESRVVEACCEVLAGTSISGYYAGGFGIGTPEYADTVKG